MFFFLITQVLSTEIRPNVNMTILMDIKNPSYLPLYKEFGKHYDEFQEKGLNLTIIQRLVPCYSCFKRHNFTQQENNCYGGGRYCQYSDIVSGQILLDEMLRQHCVLQTYPKHYFNYTIHFADKCLQKPQQMTTCVLEQFNNSQIENEIINKCIDESFDDVEQTDELLKTNHVLQFYKTMENNHSNYQLFIDSQNYTSKSIDEIQTILCKKFEYVQIKSCGEPKKSETIQKGNALEAIFIFIFAIIILLIIALGGWNLLNKIQFGAMFMPRNKVTIPREEKDHIIQEDDI